MPLSYDGVPEATIAPYVLGFIYCVPILIISFKNRHKYDLQKIHQSLSLTKKKLNENVLKKASIDNKKQEEYVDIHNKHVRDTLTSMILYSLCLLFSMIYNLPLQNAMNPILRNTFGILAQQCWNIAQVICYLIFIKKFKMIFTDTESEIQIKNIKYLYISIIVTALSELLLSILQILLISETLSFNAFLIIANIEAFFKLFINGILAMLFVYLFLNQYYKVSIASCYGHESFDDSEPSTSSNDRYQNIISSITSKLCILSIWCVISTQLFILMGVVIICLLWLENDNKTARDAVYGVLFCYNLLWIVSIIINVTCLFLCFQFSSKYYDSICIKCQNYLNRLADSKINQLNSKVDDRYSMMMDNPIQ